MNLTTLVFLGLAVVWAVVLLPEVLRKLAGSRRSDSIRSFNHQLSVLDRSGGGRAGGARPGAARAPRSNVIDLRSHVDRAATAARAARPARVSTSTPLTAATPVPMAVRKRRQDVITSLVAAAVLTLLCTVAFGGTFFLLLHLLADVLLVAYVVALYQVTQGAPAPAAQRRSRPAASAGADVAMDLRTAPVGRTTPATRRIAN